MKDGISSIDKLVAGSLRTLLHETMIRADERGAYIINHGEPGLVETLKSLSAEKVSTPPGPGRKPIVAHANHVLYGWELMNRALGGDERAFADADWNTAWRLERVSEAEWTELLTRMEQTAQQVLAIAPRHSPWDEVSLTGVFASAAHTAYHLGAIRQMLRELAEG